MELLCSALQGNPNLSTQILQTVSRAIAMLRAFDGGTAELTLKELSARLGLEKVNTLRLARTLLHEGLLTHDPQSRRYALSLGCLALFRGLLGRNELIESARRHLEHARDATGETACLMVREGWHRVAVDSIPSKHSVRYVLEIGDRRPLHMGAAGMCLLSGLDEAAWEELMARLNAEAEERPVQRRPLTIQERLQRLRDQGWVTVQGEWAAEAAGAAAPIHDAQRKVVAAVSIVVPLTRASDTHMETCGRMAMATAQSISSELARLGGAIS